MLSTDNELQTSMPRACSVCYQSGHNKRTCSFVIEYSYDEYGVKCRVNPADKTDIQPVEPYCFPCGAKTQDCECGEYKLGKWFNEDKGKWEGVLNQNVPKNALLPPPPPPKTLPTSPNV